MTRSDNARIAKIVSIAIVVSTILIIVGHIESGFFLLGMQFGITITMLARRGK